MPIVFFFYWSLANKNLRIQNLIIVVSSFIFYGWWDWRFLILMVTTIFFSYLSGLGIIHVRRTYDETTARNKLRLITALNIIINLLILGYFKYYNFFVDSFIETFSLFGRELSARSLNIILPVGISFYTFQALSYTIDVYRKKISPTKDIISFIAFISFFPQLVAGPIERAVNLLPQFQRKRHFDHEKAIEGTLLVLFGFFKKLVVADRLSPYVDAYFSNINTMSSTTAVLAILFFSFQIYCDFSGYSDIARGVSKWFGIELMINFDRPYFSTSFHQFWKRWHISLSTWFKDYLYIPLGGSRISKQKTYRNLIVVFIVSGLWHGANWTFVIWGALHAFYQVVEHLSTNFRKKIFVFFNSKFTNKILKLGSILTIYFLVCFAWIFFRAKSFDQSMEVINQIISFDFRFDSLNLFALQGPVNFILGLFGILLLLIFDLSIVRILSAKNHVKFLFSVVLLLLTVYLGKSGEAVFIYFQF